MLNKSKILLSAALACGLHQAGLAAGGEIVGVVKGDDGSVVAGASVLLRRTIPAGAPSRRATEWATSSTADGTFQFDLLPIGEYTLCAQATSGAWLNACEWGSGPTAAVIAPAGAPVSATAEAPVSVTIVMLGGVVVPIRVSDPGQLLAQNVGITPGADLLLGVRSPGLIFHSAVLTGQDSGGRDYAVTIPFGTALNLVVASSFFELANSSGAALASGTTIAISVAAGQPPPTISLTVTGHR